MYQFAALDSKTFLAITKAVALPLDQSGNPISDSNGNVYGFPANDGGVSSVPETLNGFSVASVKVSAPGYKSVTSVPQGPLTGIELVAGSDSYSAPARPTSQAAAQVVAAQQNLTAMHVQYMSDVQEMLNHFHVSMKLMFGGLLLLIVAACVYYSRSNTEK